jgi:hypothetical protein
MIAYNEQSLDRLAIDSEVLLAHKKRLLSDQEYTNVRHAHKPDLYSPNVFIRIGLFALTVVIVTMIFGLLLLITESLLYNDRIFFSITIVFGCLIYAALEWIVRVKRHYRCGVDDALLWLALICFVADIGIYFTFRGLWMSLLIFVLSLAATIRFANSVMSAVSFCAFIAVIFYSITPAGTIAKTILPFVSMLIGVAVYLMVIKCKHQHSFRHYRHCFMVIEALSLITIYASVNYFVVRELSIKMFDLHLPQNASITGGWFFWVCTLILPLIYIARGLQSKDHLILRVGLLLIAATIFTFRYYYSIAPIEQVLTFAGIILIAIAYVLIKYLQTPRFGIVDRQPEQHLQDGVNVESLVIAGSFKEAPAPDEGFRFGGGSTGGGGATGQF